MLRLQQKFQARVSNRGAVVTAIALLLISLAQYVHDQTDFTPGVSNAQAVTGRSDVSTANAGDMATEDVPDVPLRGGKISQMIFRIN
jgi:hypothetical protein